MIIFYERSYSINMEFFSCTDLHSTYENGSCVCAEAESFQLTANRTNHTLYTSEYHLSNWGIAKSQPCGSKKSALEHFLLTFAPLS